MADYAWHVIVLEKCEMAGKRRFNRYVADTHDARFPQNNRARDDRRTGVRLKFHSDAVDVRSALFVALLDGPSPIRRQLHCIYQVGFARHRPVQYARHASISDQIGIRLRDIAEIHDADRFREGG